MTSEGEHPTKDDKMNKNKINASCQDFGTLHTESHELMNKRKSSKTERRLPELQCIKNFIYYIYCPFFFVCCDHILE